jgi:pyruvate/2-oxoglutarate dehydrogenase complex dihydrolipoamide acyltransferase (E2) component
MVAQESARRGRELDETTVKVSPRARRLAQELGVALSDLDTLGKSTVHEADVRAWLAARDSAPVEAQSVEAPPSRVEIDASEQPYPESAPSEDGVGEAVVAASEALESEPPASEPVAAREEAPATPAALMSVGDAQSADDAVAEDIEIAPDDFELLEEGGAATVQEPAVSERGVATAAVTLNLLPPRETSLLPVSPIRRVIADRALASVREIPQVPLWIDIDADAILRTTGGDPVRATAAWARAVARALLGHPRLNAHYTPEGILLHAEVRLGVILRLEDGIVMPVLHHAGEKPLDTLVGELLDLEERAHARRLRGEELSGATFSLADWGAFGVRGGVPLIYPPLVGALGIGAAREVPFLREGGLLFRPACEVVLASDPRALDPAHAAAFLHALKREAEEMGR